MIKLTNTRVAFLIAAAVWALSVALGLTFRLDERLENVYLDWNLRRLAASLPPDPQIVMLDIDEATLEAMAAEHGRYPWSRAVFGQLLEGLDKLKPRAIVFDILFIDPHKGHAEDDNFLIRTARRMPNVYFPMTLLPDNSPEPGAQGFLLKDLPAARPVPGATPDARARAPMLIPLPGLTDTGRLGTINVGIDREGNVRRYALHHDIRGWRIPSLPARIATDLGYPLPPGDSLALVWHGPAFSYKRIPFHEVFFDLERRQPKMPAELLRDKIIIIGASAAGLHDLKLTPMGTHFPGP
ncbi:MAG: CHASE2 domain-containing protein, partial [Pseudomonadota bacterium]